jgi:hypothetical protein
MNMWARSRSDLRRAGNIPSLQTVAGFMFAPWNGRAMPTFLDTAPS